MSFGTLQKCRPDGEGTGLIDSARTGRPDHHCRSLQLSLLGLIAVLGLGAPLRDAQADGAVTQQVFEKGAASQSMFENYEVGGGRRRSSGGGGSSDSFAVGPDSQVGSRPKRAGSNIILPSFPAASNSAVLEKPAAPVAAPPSQAGITQEPAPSTTAESEPVDRGQAAAAILSSVSAATEQSGALNSQQPPSDDYYRKLIAEVQGKPLDDRKKRNTNVVTKAKKIGKENKF